MTLASGSIYSQDADYTNASNGTGPILTANPGAYSAGQYANIGLYYQCYLMFLEFDTSTLPASFDELYSFYWNAAFDQDATIQIALHDWGPTLTEADWLTPAELSGLTVVTSFPVTATIGTPANGPFAIPLNAGSIPSWGGIVRLVVFMEEQATGSPPVDTGGSSGIQEVNNNGPILTTRINAVDPGSVGTWEQEIAADTPTLWWKLSETSGTVAVDSSGNGHDGTYLNSPVLNQPGFTPNPSNTAVLFSHDDESAVVSVDDFAGTDFSGTGLTLECVFSAPDVTDNVIYFPVVGFEGDCEHDFETWSVDTFTGQPFMAAYLYPDTTGNSDAVVFFWADNDTPTHLAMTIPADGLWTSIVVFVNGDQYQTVRVIGEYDTVGARTLNMILPAFNTSGSHFYGAGDPYGGSNSMTGTLDEAMFYSAELSSLRVRKHYQAMLTPFVPVAPAIISISPTSGTVDGGTTVTLTGTGFFGTTLVTVDSTSVSFAVVNDNTITFTTHNHVIGAVIVEVTNDAGSDSIQYTYTPAPPPPAAFVPNDPSGGSGAGRMTMIPIRMFRDD